MGAANVTLQYCFFISLQGFSAQQASLYVCMTPPIREVSVCLEPPSGVHTLTAFTWCRARRFFLRHM